MPTDANSRAKLQSSYQELSRASSDLNSASDLLGNAVTILDESLARLNIGVTTWVTFKRWTDDDSPDVSVAERLGYAKVNNKRGLAIKVVDVDDGNGDESTQNEWLFNDAPRELRLRAIEAVPELIQSMTREARDTAKRVRVKADVALELAAAIDVMTESAGGEQQ
jgi:hypothetical protein